MVSHPEDQLSDALALIRLMQQLLQQAESKTEQLDSHGLYLVFSRLEANINQAITHLEIA